MMMMMMVNSGIKSYFLIHDLNLHQQREQVKMTIHEAFYHTSNHHLTQTLRLKPKM